MSVIKLKFRAVVLVFFLTVASVLPVLSQTDSPLSKNSATLSRRDGYALKDFISFGGVLSKDTTTSLLDSIAIVKDSIVCRQFYTYFRINSSSIDMSYMGNANHYERLEAYLMDQLRGGSSEIDSIVIIGSSSPEGNTNRNRRLSTARYMALRSYIMDRFPMIDSRRILSGDKGENWDGLLEYVEADSNVPRRQDVIGIIKMSSSRSSREYFLRVLDFGIPWRYISRNILPLLRGGASIRVYSGARVGDSDGGDSGDSGGLDGGDGGGLDRGDSVARQDSIVRQSPASSDSILLGMLFGRDTLSRAELTRDTLSLDTLSLDTLNRVAFKLDTPPVVAVAGRPLWSVKTNLLYWAALQANVEAEFYFGRHWSLNFEYQIAWWKNSSKHQYYQFTHCGPEGRYWFRGDNNFRGHYVGIHVGFGIYDLSLGVEDQQYEGYQGEFAIALGISYGYVWKLGKILHLEAGFGFGYVMTEYRRYRYIDQCYVYQATERMQFLGPTKARVTLQWRIGTGALGDKRGVKKGGVR